MRHYVSEIPLRYLELFHLACPKASPGQLLPVAVWCLPLPGRAQLPISLPTPQGIVGIPAQEKGDVSVSSTYRGLHTLMLTASSREQPLLPKEGIIS